MVSGANRRTLKAIYRHPFTDVLKWSRVAALFENLGEIEEESKSDFVFQVLGAKHSPCDGYGNDVTISEVIDLRHFLLRAGWSPDYEPQSAIHPIPETPGLMIVLDRHGAKIFQIDVASGDALSREIKPFSNHRIVDQADGEIQSREPDKPMFYERIARAVATDGRIVVVGHGEGKTSAADHLTEYLLTHHHQTYLRIVREVVADLSRITTRELLEIARRALRQES